MQIGTDIREFELEVTLKDGSQQEYDYRKRDGQVRAKAKMRDKEGKRTRQDDQEAIRTAERLLSELAPSADMSHEQLISRARSALHLSEEAIAHLEVEVEFSDGTEIEAKTWA